MMPDMSNANLVPATGPKASIPQTLLKVVSQRKVLGPKSEVLHQGDIPQAAHLLLHGHTYRYRLLSDGRRQITAVLVPGDICDLEAVMRGRADYAVGTLTNCILGEIPKEQVAEPHATDPKLMHLICRRLLRDEAIAREWLVGLGRRRALERVAHLLCEFRVRLQAVGLAHDNTFNFPLNQIELSDVLGLSYVHINRTIQELRRIGLIQLSSTLATIIDCPALEKLAGFDPSYLKSYEGSLGA